jgi:ribonuclease HI
MNKQSNKILIYTDGSSLGNPGPGGYGIVMKTSEGQYEKHFSKGFKKTTNNRMELMAVIEALKKINDKSLPVEIYSDSKYVVDAINKNWLQKWQKERFAKTKNPDLWKEFLEISKGLDFSIHWVKGHNNHHENEICDKLAVKAAKGKNLIPDKGFEKSQEDTPPSLF